MLNAMNFPRFLRALDACAVEDVARICMGSIMVLSATKTHTRVFATDAGIAVIVDVETALLEYAITTNLLFRFTCKDEICYRTYAKRIVKEDDLFPFPQITRVIPDMKLMTENTAACFAVKNIQRYCKIMEAYEDLKPGKIRHFQPNYGTKSLRSAFCHIIPGMMVLIMPIMTRYLLAHLEKNDTLSIDECLPGLLTDKKG